MVRRFLGLFWPIFHKNLEGNILFVDITLQILIKNRAQKNPKIDRTLFCRHPQKAHYD